MDAAEYEERARRNAAGLEARGFNVAARAHACTPPEPTRDAEDWTCPDCGQAYWVDDDHCLDCGRSGPLRWRPFGTGDGTFPLVTVGSGPIMYPSPGVTPRLP